LTLPNSLFLAAIKPNIIQKVIKPRLLFLYLFISIIAFLHVDLLFAQDDSVSSFAQQIISLTKKLEDEKKLVGKLDSATLLSLPVGIAKEIGSTKYIIAVDSASFRPGGAFFSAYMAVEFPGTESKIAFAAQHVWFNPKGIGGGPSTKLLLVSEHKIKISEKITLHLKPDGTNYVEWDCNGFKSISLKGYFEFQPGMLYPDTSATTAKIVTASFQITATDIHNFIADVNITPFCIQGLKDFAFSVKDASVDLSELVNAPGMTFPKGYANTGGTSPVLWTGFCMRELKIKLPPELSKKGKRMEITASSFLIDKTGVSGTIGISNLLTTDEGDMSGWNFSIDNFSLEFLSNQLNGGSMAGLIHLPFMKDNSSLKYSAEVFQNHTFNETDYTFIVAPEKNIEFSVFAAKIDLYNTSAFSITKLNGKFKPTAILNGAIGIESSTATLPKLTFEKLTVTSESPYITCGAFGLSGPISASVGGFFASIDSLRIVLDGKHPELDVEVTIGFMSEGDEGFAASAGLAVIGKIEESKDPNTHSTKTKWSLDKVQLNEISLDVETEPFSLTGGIAYKENDLIYGKGMFGSLSFILHCDPTEFAFAVNAGFGAKDNLRYWYVEGMAEITIPLPPYANIKRMMGGMYYHMKPKGTASFASMTTNLNPNNKSKVIINYLPDATAGYGFKAGVTLAYIQSEKVLNGDILITVNLNSSGGLGSLALDGLIACMTTIDERQKTPLKDQKLSADMHMIFDNANSTFHATMTVYMNLSAVKGSGEAVMHFDPHVWYVCIGKPSSPVNLTLFNALNIKSYFMVGEDLEPMAAVPDLVLSLVAKNGIGKLRLATSLKNGSGFATGLQLSLDKSANFGVGSTANVYYVVHLLAGFDVMLADYGTSAHCSNVPGKMGVNGWYCQGQLYVAVQGKFGAHIETILGTWDGEILSLSAAALLQGQFPNPSYLYGTVGVHLQALKLLSYDYNMEFSYGTQCRSIIN